MNTQSHDSFSKSLPRIESPFHEVRKLITQQKQASLREESLAESLENIPSIVIASEDQDAYVIKNCCRNTRVLKTYNKNYLNGIKEDESPFKHFSGSRNGLIANFGSYSENEFPEKLVKGFSTSKDSSFCYGQQK